MSPSDARDRVEGFKALWLEEAKANVRPLNDTNSHRGDGKQLT
jgi:hypothetical protein